MFLSPKDFQKSESLSPDMDLYFKKTIIRVIPAQGKPEWLMFDGYDGGRWRFSRAPKEYVSFSQKELLGLKFDIRFPTGFFNTEDSVVFIERLGARVATKGLNATHSIHLTPMEHMVAAALKSPWPQLAHTVKLTPKFCNSVFEKLTYSALDDAKKQIRSGKMFARALSPCISLVPHWKTSDLLIFLRWHPVAELVSGNRIRVTLPEFRTELVEFFAPRGLDFIPEKQAK